MKYIQKKIVSELPKTVGSITDTLNVEDKSRNAPSINLVSQMAGVPTEGIIAYETEDGSIPEGYEEVENPNEIPVVTTTTNGLMSAVDKVKLDKIESKITKINTSDFITIQSGYTITSSCVFKDRNRYFGTMVVKKSSNFSSGQETIATLKKGVHAPDNSGCFFSNDEWSTKAVGYLYIGNTQILVKCQSDNTYNFVKINFDLVTTE